jgi:hypothetical protein
MSNTVGRFNVSPEAKRWLMSVTWEKGETMSTVMREIVNSAMKADLKKRVKK